MLGRAVHGRGKHLIELTFQLPFMQAAEQEPGGGSSNPFGDGVTLQAKPSAQWNSQADPCGRPSQAAPRGMAARST